MIAKESRVVLEAAENWLSAMEAITAADEAQCRTDNEQDALDSAEVALVAAVKTWRAREIK